jgi:signal peptidase II
MTRSSFAFLTAILVLVLDRIAKILVVDLLAPGASIDVVPGIFSITLVHNTGAAFGMFKGMTGVFSVISLIVAISISVYILKNKMMPRVFALSLGLILGGAIGNMIDRVWLGYVIDFFDFHVWPVFNIADSCITIGTTALAINILSLNSKK